MKRFLILFLFFVSPAFATHVSDNFNRPDGSLGGNWSVNNIDGPSISCGTVVLQSHAYAPSNTCWGNSLGVWNAGQPFQPDQYALARISTIAPLTSIVNITAASQSGSNTTYTYTLTAGSALIINEGFVISGMADAGNNCGPCYVTGLGAGTFTVVNASGVTRAGQNGTGLSPSNSTPGLCLRATPDGQNAYFFLVGSNASLGASDRRVYTHEIWKNVAGVQSALRVDIDTTYPYADDSTTVYGFFVIGTTIGYSRNGVVLGTVTDATLSSGSPGVFSWSLSGTNTWSGTPANNAPGNSGGSMTDWQAGDVSTNLAAALSTESFTGGPVVSQLKSDSFPYANGDLHTLNNNWAYQGSSTFAVNANRAFSSHAGVNTTYRSDASPNNDQYVTATMVLTGLAATQNDGPGVRVAAGADTAYSLQVATNLFRLAKDVAGTPTTLQDLSGTFIPSNGDSLGIYASGSVIIATDNGNWKMSQVDSSIASGNVGYWGAGNSTTNGISAWAGGNITSLYSSHFSNGSPNQTFWSDTTNGVTALQADSGNLTRAWENTVTWPADQWVQATATSVDLTGVSSTSGPSARVDTGTNTWYSCGMTASAGTLTAIFKLVNGAATLLTSTHAHVYAANDVIKLVVQGQMIECFINGTLTVETVDNSIASGNAGININLVGGTPGTPNGTPHSTFKTWSAGRVMPTNVARNITPPYTVP